MPKPARGSRQADTIPRPGPLRSHPGTQSSQAFLPPLSPWLGGSFYFPAALVATPRAWDERLLRSACSWERAPCRKPFYPQAAPRPQSRGSRGRPAQPEVGSPGPKGCGDQPAHLPLVTAQEVEMQTRAGLCADPPELKTGSGHLENSCRWSLGACDSCTRGLSFLQGSVQLGEVGAVVAILQREPRHREVKLFA